MQQLRQVVGREEAIIHHLQRGLREQPEILGASCVPLEHFRSRPWDVRAGEARAYPAESDLGNAWVPARVGGDGHVDERMAHAADGVAVAIGGGEEDRIRTAYDRRPPHDAVREVGTEVDEGGWVWLDGGAVVRDERPVGE